MSAVNSQTKVGTFLYLVDILILQPVWDIPAVDSSDVLLFVVDNTPFLVRPSTCHSNASQNYARAMNGNEILPQASKWPPRRRRVLRDFL